MSDVADVGAAAGFAIVVGAAEAVGVLNGTSVDAKSACEGPAATRAATPPEAGWFSGAADVLRPEADKLAGATARGGAFAAGGADATGAGRAGGTAGAPDFEAGLIGAVLRAGATADTEGRLAAVAADAPRDVGAERVADALDGVDGAAGADALAGANAPAGAAAPAGVAAAAGAGAPGGVAGAAGEKAAVGAVAEGTAVVAAGAGAACAASIGAGGVAAGSVGEGAPAARAEGADTGDVDEGPAAGVEAAERRADDDCVELEICVA